MGEIKKKQHYVPRFYLKYFANTENKFYAYDLKMNGMVSSPVYYESQCYKKFFYGDDGILEDQLSKKERGWSAVCKKAISGDELNEVDISLLKEFVLYQKQRTSGNNDLLREEREAIIKECTKQLYYAKGWEFDDKAEKICRQRAMEDVTPAENVFLAAEMGNYIEDLGILIIRYSTCNKLLTTDSPVVTLNAFMLFQGYGYDSMGVAFIMPLSPEVLLMVYDDQFYKGNNGKIYVDSRSEEEIEIINRYEIIHAERMCFSADINNFSLMTEETLEHRQEEEKRKQPTFLGPENGQRLFAMKAEGINYYYNLSYLMFPREYRRIPYVCREMIPRHFEKGWESKLALKYQVLCMAQQLSDDQETKRLLHKTDLKIGCRRMENLARIYWNEKGYSMM